VKAKLESTYVHLPGSLAKRLVALKSFVKNYENTGPTNEGDIGAYQKPKNLPKFSPKPKKRKKKRSKPKKRRE